MSSTPPENSEARGMDQRVEQTELVAVLAALSLATDLANGNPPETALKLCLSAVNIAQELGCPPEVRADIFYASLLRFIGCTAYSHEEAAALGGDDVGARNLFAPLDSKRPLKYLSVAARGLGKGAGFRKRASALANVALRGQTMYADMARSNCEVAVRLADRLGMPTGVQGALAHLFERWDGAGAPAGVAEEDIPIAARVLTVVQVAELQFRHAGEAAATEVLRARAGSQLDPRAARAFLEHSEKHFACFRAPSVWDELLESRPPNAAVALELEAIASAFADFVDLKSVYTPGHSIGVARLAELAARELGLPAAQCEQLRVAGYLHDLGKVSIPSGIWEKKGALSVAEWERVHLHPYYSETILKKSPILAPLAPIVAAHHERMDGSGYFRGRRGGELPTSARVLAAADAFQALFQKRPHRDALTGSSGPRTFAACAPNQLDRLAVNAILEISGNAAHAPGRWPDGLTDREIEVLRLLARGLSNKEIAATLSISPKTVQHHVQHIYEKTQLSSRAGATLFAVENGLLGPAGG